MKVFIGILIGLFLSLVSFDVADAFTSLHYDRFNFKSCNENSDYSDCVDLYEKKHSVIQKLSLWLISPGIGLSNPLRGACVKSGSMINGKNYRGRDYFECNRFQVFLSDTLFGENGQRFLQLKKNK